MRQFYIIRNELSWLKSISTEEDYSLSNDLIASLALGANKKLLWTGNVSTAVPRDGITFQSGYVGIRSRLFMVSKLVKLANRLCILLIFYANCELRHYFSARQQQYANYYEKRSE